MPKPINASIAAQLLPLTIPIDSIAPHPRNVRQGDIGAIASSLRQFGQQKPVVVQQSTGTIVAGNHLWRAAVALGWTTIAANVVDLDDATALAYLIADNRTQELGTTDDALLARVLTDLAAVNLLDATGYDGDDLDALIASVSALERDWPELPAIDRHQITISYTLDDEPAIKAFVRQHDDLPLAPEHAGRRVLERIREIAATDSDR